MAPSQGGSGVGGYDGQFEWRTASRWREMAQFTWGTLLVDEFRSSCGGRGKREAPKITSLLSCEAKNCFHFLAKIVGIPRRSIFL